MKGLLPDYISQWFTNPNNIKDRILLDDGKMISSEEFYSIGESLQERACIITNKIECKDGFSMSVQASSGHYCTPRTTFRSSHFCAYTEFEVGYPSKKEMLLMPYAESSTKPTDTIYPYTPKGIINKVIDKHGGLIKDSKIISL